MKFTDQLKGAEQHDYEYDRILDRVTLTLDNLGDPDTVADWIKSRGFTIKEWKTMVEILFASGAEPRAIISGAIQFGYQLAEEAKTENLQSSH